MAQNVVWNFNLVNKVLEKDTRKPEFEGDLHVEAAKLVGHLCRNTQQTYGNT